MKRIYGATPDTRLFSSSKNPYLQHMKKHEALAGLHHIRLHDLRHSHASLLIELGFSALLVWSGSDMKIYQPHLIYFLTCFRQNKVTLQTN